MKKLENGNLLNISELSRSMGLSTTTLSRYLGSAEKVNNSRTVLQRCVFQ
jgi:DNA-binding IclR family transcriptional regulator